MLPRPDNPPLTPEQRDTADRILDAMLAQERREKHVRAAWYWLTLVALPAILAGFLGRNTWPGYLALGIGLAASWRTVHHLNRIEDAEKE